MSRSFVPASAPAGWLPAFPAQNLAGCMEAWVAVLKAAIALGGSSVSDYVDADGVRGFFQLEHRVYMRTGEPCLVCGTADPKDCGGWPGYALLQQMPALTSPPNRLLRFTGVTSLRPIHKSVDSRLMVWLSCSFFSPSLWPLKCNCISNQRRPRTWQTGPA